MQHGEHLARVMGLIVVAAGVAVAPAGPAAAEEPYELQWARLIGTAEDDYSHSMTLDVEGNIIICGRINRYVPWTIYTDDVFVAKCTPAGAVLWTRQDGPEGSDIAEDVALDSAGNIYIAGTTQGRLYGSWDVLLAKYSPSGDLLWWRQFGTSGSDWAKAIVVDSEDHVYLSGHTDGDLYGTSAGSIDAFVAMYDSEGAEVWGRQFGGAGADVACGLALDSAGDLVLGGTAWLAKYTTAGDERWVRPVATPYPEILLRGMTLDAADNIYLVGDIYFSSGDQCAALLLKTDAQGAFLWSQQHDPSSIKDEYWRGVAVDAAGSAYVAGAYGPSWGYEGAVVMQLAKYGPSGDQIWLETPALGARDSSASSVIIDSAGNLFISGSADRLFGVPGAGRLDALVARLQPACYADCDGSGALDFFDFLCFQDAFALADPYADCDGTGALDFFDFLCFQNAFAAGCPG
ncbi:MAG: SBBP repeat-containing protein [Phycisphaerales bacterium JB039]